MSWVDTPPTLQLQPSPPYHMGLATSQMGNPCLRKGPLGSWAHIQWVSPSLMSDGYLQLDSFGAQHGGHNSPHCRLWCCKLQVTSVYCTCSTCISSCTYIYKYIILSLCRVVCVCVHSHVSFDLAMRIKIRGAKFGTFHFSQLHVCCKVNTYVL